MAIRLAEPEDLDRVLEIARGVAPDSARNGFLVSNYGRDDYALFLADPENVLFLVGENADGGVAGFFIAWNEVFSRRHPAYVDYRQIEKVLHRGASYWLIKQVAIDNAHQKRGFATQLYEEFFRLRPGRHVFTAIVREPPNIASENFHHRLGFRPFSAARSKVLGSDATYPNRLWYAPGLIRHQSLDAEGIAGLLTNLDTAIGLYNHEDNLNWTKTRFFLTMLLALFATAWFLMRFDAWVAAEADEPFGVAKYVGSLVALALLGYVLLWWLSQMIESGVRFMASHKLCAAAIETIVAERVPGYVPTLAHADRVSRTVLALKQLPRLALLAWTCMTLMMALRVVGVLGRVA